MSVKLKIVIWYSIVIIAIAAVFLCAGYPLFKRFEEATEKGILGNVVAFNATEVWMQDGEIYYPNYQEYQDGVYTVLFNNDHELIAGISPVNVDPEKYALEPFTYGETVIEGQTIYYYDVFVVSSDENWIEITEEDRGNVYPQKYDGVWLRGIKPVSSYRFFQKQNLTFLLILFPALAVLAFFGGWFVTKKAFRSVKDISETAIKIADGDELSKRIPVTPGKDEIHELVNTINQMLERLEESFNQEKQFTSDVAHELRTPLAVLLGECETASMESMSQEKYQQMILRMRECIIKMTNLVSHLLSFSRLSQGTQKLECERMNLSELVEAICMEQDNDIASESIQLIPEIQPDIEVFADNTLLMSLIQNLISNAYKYGKENGHIWVRVYKEKEKACVSVQDDGIGISEENLPYIWNRFYRTDHAKIRNYESGFGLGLAIVQEIAKLHQGNVTVESKEGEGSIFIFSINAI